MSREDSIYVAGETYKDRIQPRIFFFCRISETPLRSTFIAAISPVEHQTNSSRQDESLLQPPPSPRGSYYRYCGSHARGCSRGSSGSRCGRTRWVGTCTQSSEVSSGYSFANPFVLDMVIMVTTVNTATMEPTELPHMLATAHIKEKFVVLLIC